MAKILLNVEINNALAKKQLTELEKSIETVANSLNKIKLSADISKQVNSLANYSNALTREKKAQLAAAAAEDNHKLAAQKLATELKRTETQTERVREATAKAEKAEVSATTAKEKYIAAQKRGTSATRATREEQEKATKSLEKGTDANEKHTQSIWSMAKGFLQWQVAAALVMRPLNLIRSAISDIGETVVDTENKVVELQRVLSENINGKDISDTLYGIAKEFGRTFDEVSEIAANFAKAGMSWTDSIKATKAAVLALNVAELDASEASEGLISILNQFELEVDELTNVIDILNKTADNFPVTTEKLLTALQRTGSSAKNANLELTETVGIITAISAATNRSGENIGTAVNSLIQFSTKAESLDTFAKLGGDVETAVERYRKGVGDVLDIWSSLSEVVQNSNNSTESILGGLFGDSDWESLNSELQEALGENYATVTEIYDTASTYRKNYFIALLNNMDTVEAAMAEMDSAAGYSAKENEQYLDTYQAKLNTLQAKWQELANDEQGILALKKALVDMGINALELVDNLGGLVPVLRSIAILAGTIAAIANFDKITGFIGKAAEMLPTLLHPISSITRELYLLSRGMTTTATASQVLSIATKGLIGGVGLVATGISVGVSALTAYIQKQKEARKATIDTWEAHKEEAATLDELLKKYKAYTDYQSQEALKTEEEIISLLGEKAEALGLLTKGTDEYREALENLTEQDLRHYEAEKAIAATNAKKNLKTANVGNKYIGKSVLFDQQTSLVLANAGVDLSYAGQGASTTFSIAGLSAAYDAEAQYNNYKILLDAYDKLTVEWKKAYLEGNEEYAEKVLGVMQGVKKSIEDSETAAKDYENTLKDATLQTEELAKETGEVAKKAKTLDSVSSSVADSLVEKLKQQRDAIKAAREEEQTREAVLEAENKLLDAQNDKIKAQKDLIDTMENRNIRIYNAQTGLWEWNANAKDVEKAKDQVEQAEENIEKAQEDLEKARFDAEIAAYDEIIDYLEKGGRDIDEVKKILEKWQIAYNGTLLSGEPKFLTDILQAFTALGISLSNTQGEQNVTTTSRPNVYMGGSARSENFDQKPSAPNWYETPVDRYRQREAIYDEGGILEGEGGIKATAKPETVLPPDITAKLLEPTPNKRFKDFAESLGYLFASLEKPRASSEKIIKNYGGNTDNRNYDNRNYSVNGIPIPTSVAETHTLAEIFNTMSLIPNN